MLITVITPTYNRLSKIKNLLKSLEKQTCLDFEWLVVDDGSSDNTEEFFNKLNTTIKFKYIKKLNGGKHTALNVGINLINSPLTIIVDSDDVLLPNAIKIIKDNYFKYQNNKEIGVLSFLKIFSNGNAVVPMEENVLISSYINYRIKQNKPGDMAEVFITKVLKENPFPEFKNERFLSEDIVWINIALKYKTVFINEPIYECEYLADGLTANDKKMKFASPLGSMLRGKQLMLSQCGLKANFKGAIIYNCYKLEVNNTLPSILHLDTFKSKFLVLSTKLLGKYYNKKWKAFMSK